jgi:polyisoprenoid-binding protein YceI
MKKLLLCFMSFLVVGFTFIQAQVIITLHPESAVEYEAHDQTDRWTGRAPVSRLEFTLNPERLGDSSLTIAVKPGDFSSGNFFRDTNAQRTVFETGKYPEIVFVSKRVQSEGGTLADGESREVTLTGDLTMHGVTKELETTATLTRTGNTLTATGGFDIKLTDFGMKPPTLFNIVVDENVIVRFIVTGEMQ